jgi:allantoicase
VKVLTFAYACEPGKGSEPGAGWGLARMIARELGECWVITRANNRHAIE